MKYFFLTLQQIRLVISFDIQANSLPNSFALKNVGNYFTVWKFQDFSVIQILREIDFGEFRSSKTVVFTILRAVNF